jgi:hypothetical protein
MYQPLGTHGVDDAPDAESGLARAPALPAAPGHTPLSAARASAWLRRHWPWLVELAFVFFASWGLNWLLHNPYCGEMFQCGCTWNFAGGWSRCNVHNAEGPHCPFCAARKELWWSTDDRFYSALMTLAWGVLAVRQTRAGLPQRAKIPARVLVPVATFFVSFFLVGVIYFLANPDYPYFFFFSR